MRPEELSPDEERALRERLSAVVPDHRAAPQRASRAIQVGRRHRLAAVAGSVVASVAVVAALAIPLLGGGPRGDDVGVTDVGTSETSGSTTPEPTTPTPSNQTTEPWDPHGDRPPPVTVRYGTESLGLEAWSFCYGNLCVAGGPPKQPPSVGSVDQVFIDFPLEDWSFQATFQPVGEKCGRMQTVELGETGQRSLVLEPVGYADTYDVTLFGRGNGDLATTFRWSTPYDGPLPTPEATLAVVSGEPGDLTSYGVELMVSNLAATPESATATITVTAANNETLTFELDRDNRCRAEGTVYWDGPAAKGMAAAALGPAPFRYEVVLMLDGKRYVGTAEWPQDEIKGNEPSVALTFEPALPSLG